MSAYLKALMVLGAGFVAVALLWPSPQKPAAPAPPAHIAAQTAPVVIHAPHPTGPRIWYAANNTPRLTLPDGQHKIVHSVLNITEPMHFGSYVWNDTNIPDGPVWVRVDLEKQLLSVFRAGHEIGSAVILYGAAGKPTPTGDFAILEKRRDYHSRSYDAPMPFMLRLTDDGVAIHGSDVRKDWATHGCIGVPLEFARLLFAVAHKGDLVVIQPAGQGAEKA